MQTPWGDFPVCDAHVHFFSPAFFALLAAQSGQPVEAIGRTLGWRLPPACEDLAASWVQELDEYSVAKAALIASVPGDEDSVATAVRLHPDRFWGFFMANPAAPSDAPGGVARVQDALAGGFMQGVCLFPAMHRYSVADPRVRPVFEAAAAHPGTIVFVHCGVLTVGVRRKLGLPSLFDMRYSNPIDLHAVAMEFPTVNFVIPHFGAGYFREALMLCDLCPNVYLDTLPIREAGFEGCFPPGAGSGRPAPVVIRIGLVVLSARMARADLSDPDTGAVRHRGCRGSCRPDAGR